MEIMHAAPRPRGAMRGEPEGAVGWFAGRELAAQEEAGLKGKREGMRVGVVNFEEVCEVV